MKVTTYLLTLLNGKMHLIIGVVQHRTYENCLF